LKCEYDGEISTPCVLVKRDDVVSVITGNPGGIGDIGVGSFSPAVTVKPSTIAVQRHQFDATEMIREALLKIDQYDGRPSYDSENPPAIIPMCWEEDGIVGGDAVARCQGLTIQQITLPGEYGGMHGENPYSGEAEIAAREYEQLPGVPISPSEVEPPPSDESLSAKAGTMFFGANNYVGAGKSGGDKGYRAGVTSKEDDAARTHDMLIGAGVPVAERQAIMQEKHGDTWVNSMTRAFENVAEFTAELLGLRGATNLAQDAARAARENASGKVPAVIGVEAKEQPYVRVGQEGSAFPNAPVVILPTHAENGDTKPADYPEQHNSATWHTSTPYEPGVPFGMHVELLCYIISLSSYFMNMSTAVTLWLFIGILEGSFNPYGNGQTTEGTANTTLAKFKESAALYVAQVISVATNFLNGNISDSTDNLADFVDRAWMRPVTCTNQDSTTSQTALPWVSMGAVPQTIFTPIAGGAWAAVDGLPRQVFNAKSRVLAGEIKYALGSWAQASTQNLVGVTTKVAMESLRSTNPWWDAPGFAALIPSLGASGAGIGKVLRNILKYGGRGAMFDLIYGETNSNGVRVVGVNGSFGGYFPYSLNSGPIPPLNVLFVNQARFSIASRGGGALTGASAQYLDNNNVNLRYLTTAYIPCPGIFWQMNAAQQMMWILPWLEYPYRAYGAAWRATAADIVNNEDVSITRGVVSQIIFVIPGDGLPGGALSVCGTPVPIPGTMWGVDAAVGVPLDISAGFAAQYNALVDANWSALAMDALTNMAACTMFSLEEFVQALDGYIEDTTRMYTPPALVVNNVGTLQWYLYATAGGGGAIPASWPVEPNAFNMEIPLLDGLCQPTADVAYTAAGNPGDLYTATMSPAEVLGRTWGMSYPSELSLITILNVRYGNLAVFKHILRPYRENMLAAMINYVRRPLSFWWLNTGAGGMYPTQQSPGTRVLGCSDVLTALCSVLNFKVPNKYYFARNRALQAPTAGMLANLSFITGAQVACLTRINQSAIFDWFIRGSKVINAPLRYAFGPKDIVRVGVGAAAAVTFVANPKAFIDMLDFWAGTNVLGVLFPFTTWTTARDPSVFTSSYGMTVTLRTKMSASGVGLAALPFGFFVGKASVGPLEFFGRESALIELGWSTVNAAFSMQPDCYLFRIPGLISGGIDVEQPSSTVVNYMLGARAKLDALTGMTNGTPPSPDLKAETIQEAYLKPGSSMNMQTPMVASAVVSKV